jgi:hypothetical protein
MQSQVLFGTDDHVFQPLGIDEYDIFHGHPNPSAPSTITEHPIEHIHQVTHWNARLLTIVGKLAFGVQAKFLWSREFFLYFMDPMKSNPNVMTISERMAQTKQCISHRGLSLESKHLPTNKISIKVSDSDGYGLGNPSTLQITDTINIVDDLFGDIDAPPDIWFDVESGDSEMFMNERQKCINWLFNTHLMECTMSMQCYAIKVGACNAPALV